MQKEAQVELTLFESKISNQNEDENELKILETELIQVECRDVEQSQGYQPNKSNTEGKISPKTSDRDILIAIMVFSLFCFCISCAFNLFKNYNYALMIHKSEYRVFMLMHVFFCTCYIFFGIFLGQKLYRRKLSKSTLVFKVAFMILICVILMQILMIILYASLMETYN
ncbi:hypothetical protein EDEG_01089 [Edhazardia aedis USNM 41457]|uniref:Uncharacterized protein n=1 Tax=Edhazardia aedis (strain USNM 41457) TaxID=1003232 RepID=J8ZYH0_EDHAE|nr:hypothetical protein EDEG_01089 [Edhazardia aedis USNM 41457]|eukprot:EJW04703.1 hypothetical protein EDEG_01089 [Edhazardia aedis USNM 41457]